jgi:O-antigen ligase
MMTNPGYLIYLNRARVIPKAILTGILIGMILFALAGLFDLYRQGILQDLTDQMHRLKQLMSPLLFIIVLLIFIKYEFSIILFILFIPLFQLFRFFFDTQESILVPENIIILMSLGLLLHKAKVKGPAVRSSYTALQIFYLILVFISVLFIPTEKPWHMFYICYLLPFVYFLCLKEWLRDRTEKIAFAIPLSVAIASWPMFYFTIVGTLSMGNLGEAISYFRGGTSNTTASYILLTFPLLLSLYKISNKKVTRFGILAAGVVFLLSLVISMSRGVYLVMPVAVILLWRFKIISGKRIAVLALLILFMQSILFDYFGQMAQRIEQFEGMQDERMVMIITYLKMIMESPLLGFGPGNFYGSPLSAAMIEVYNTPNHNLFTYIAAETGVPSLLMIVLMVIICMVYSIRCMKLSNDDNAVILSKGIFTGMISFLLYAHTTGAVFVEENIAMLGATGSYLFISILLLQEAIYKNAINKLKHA